MKVSKVNMTNHLSLVSFLLTLPLFAPQFALADPEWNLVKKDADLTLYERNVPGSDLVAFKFDGVLDAPIDRVAAVILDYKRTSEWVDHLEEERLLRQVSATEFIAYTHIGTPFVMKDRDFVIRVRVEVNPQERRLVITNESTTDSNEPDHGYVRGEVIKSTFGLVAIDGDHTRLVGEIHADPKGSVPKWIVNVFQKSWPRDTFDRIQVQLKKSDISIPEALVPLLARLHAPIAMGFQETSYGQ
jgi:hypothetical protein